MTQTFCVFMKIEPDFSFMFLLSGATEQHKVRLGQVHRTTQGQTGHRTTQGQTGHRTTQGQTGSGAQNNTISSFSLIFPGMTSLSVTK